MKLSAPKVVTFIIAVVLIVLALIGKLATIPFITANAFWILFVGALILVLGSFLKGI